jgi:hypothetical protein
MQGGEAGSFAWLSQFFNVFVSAFALFGSIFGWMFKSFAQKKDFEAHRKSTEQKLATIEEKQESTSLYLEKMDDKLEKLLKVKNE